MTAPDVAFTQMYNQAVVDALQVLGKVSAHVFLALGAFSSDPIAPSCRDLCFYTKHSKPSVSGALEFLCKLEFAHCFVAEDGIRRYRADERYFRYKASAPVSVRERVPVSERVSEAKGEVKFYFTSDSSRSVRTDFTDKSRAFQAPPPLERGGAGEETAAQAILHAAGWFSIAKDLPNFNDEDYALALAQKISENPMRAQDPASYVRSCVMLNQNWGRPAPKESVYVGAHALTREDFTDFEWKRLAPLNRRTVIANDRGCDISEVEDDPK